MKTEQTSNYHTVDSFTITLRNSADGESCSVLVTADPAIPDGCEEIADTPNVVMLETIMQYLDTTFDGDFSEQISNTHLH